MPALAADRECMAETGESENRLGNLALEDERIKVYTLTKEREPENLMTEVSEPQQKRQEALTCGKRLTSEPFDQINNRDLNDAPQV